MRSRGHCTVDSVELERSVPYSVAEHELINGPFTITSLWGEIVSIKRRKYMETYAFM